MSNETEKKVANPESSMILGMFMFSLFLTIALLVIGFFLATFNVSWLTEDWVNRALLPVCGMTGVIILYGIIRWAVHYGIVSAGDECNKRIIDMYSQIPDTPEVVIPTAPDFTEKLEKKQQEWKEVNNE